MTWEPPTDRPKPQLPRVVAVALQVTVVGLLLAVALAGVVKLWVWVL